MKLLRPSYMTAFALFAALRAISPLTTTVVLGHSMEPALRPGAFYVLDRGYYRSHAVRRGDIVVLKLNGETYIKRVSALSGDRLWLLRYEDGTADELLEPEEAARLRQIQLAGRLPGRRVLLMIIPPDECFVLGDNSNVSIDSREFGPVPIDSILGRAML
jgi:signal peptidase I